MSKKSGNNINFYAAYQEATRERRTTGKGTLAILALVLLLVALAGAFLSVKLKNLQKQAALDGVNGKIAQLSDAYNEVTQLSEQSAALQQTADELESDAAFATIYPAPDENLFTQVNACAGETFNISVFRYNEETATLEIDASAPSVNDMPKLVSALRGTGLFSSVQYVGYTSDTDGVYYCTVGCVLKTGEVEADE